MIFLMNNNDGTYTLRYREREVGHISKVIRYADKQRPWRLVSVHGQIEYETSLRRARNRLMEICTEEEVMTVVSLNQVNKPMEDFMKSARLAQMMKLDFQIYSSDKKVGLAQKEAIEQILSLLAQVGTTESRNVNVWRDIARYANHIVADIGE